MTRHSDLVLAHLAAYPEGQDDDQIGAALHINRIQINSICRRLAAAGVIVRGKSSSQGKIINRLSSQAGTDEQIVSLAASAKPPVAPDIEVTVAGAIVWLSDVHALQKFAYDGTASLSEDVVKAAIKQVLEADGWHVEVRWGHILGIDIEATRGDERIVLEAKGEGISVPERGNYFDSALGELLRRMHGPGSRYGLAFPAHRRFTGLVARMPLWIRQHLSLWFFFVRPVEHGLEVGAFPPDDRLRL